MNFQTPQPAPRGGAIDPASLEMLWARLRSAANEQAATLVRTAFSMVVRDLADYACSVFDSKARLIAQADSNTPGLCGSMGRMLVHMLKKYPAETLEPGDVLVSNNPWEATGHHNDITIYTPVFHGAQLIGYTACAAHYIDIGGRRADIGSRDNYEEGLRIPVCKLYRRGEPNEDVHDFIRENVRDPETLLGDMHAQVAANYVAARRMVSIVEQFEDLELTDVTDEIIRRSRKLTIDTIRSFPRGRYTAEASVPNVHGHAVEMRVAVDMREDEILIDFAGSSPQLPIAVNCTLAYTKSYGVFALYTLLNLKIPINEGVLDCLNVTAPEGSLFNASFPAPVFGRSLTGNLIPELVYKAVAPVLPKNVMAASGATPVWLHNFFGTGPDGRKISTLNAVSGGLGARHNVDGLSCLFFPVNITNLPVELMETEIPIVVERRALRTDSCGHGAQRGGLGQEFAFRVLDGDAGPQGGKLDLVVRGSRGSAVWGLFDGSNAPAPEILMNGERMPEEWAGKQLASGDTVRFLAPGGGGYGDPRDRDPGAVDEDVRNGLISGETALRIYGRRG